MDKKAFALRLSPELWEALQQAAYQDFRSVNAEVEVLLREALKSRGRRILPNESKKTDQEPGSGAA